MSRSDYDRLGDIEAACDAIASHLASELADDSIVYDAIRIRIVEIGEAVKDIDPKLLRAEPDIQWKRIAQMRDQLTHRYFDTAHSIVRNTAINDVPALRAAVGRLLASRNKKP